MDEVSAGVLQDDLSQPLGNKAISTKEGREVKQTKRVSSRKKSTRPSGNARKARGKKHRSSYRGTSEGDDSLLEDDPELIAGGDSWHATSRDIDEGRIYNRSLRKRIVRMSWTGIIVLCAEPKMGKTRILAEAVNWRCKHGPIARYEDFSGLNMSQTMGKLKNIVKWSQNASQARQQRLIAIDEIAAGNDQEATTLVRWIHRIYANRCAVLIGITPEQEVLAELIKNAAVYWSCDLKTEMPEDEIACNLYKLYVHGIPHLDDAVGRLQTTDPELVLSDPSYAEQYLGVLESSLRSQLMKDDLYLRACMVLLGKGTFKDLRSVLGKMDGTLCNDIARDAPFFGVDIVHREFCCVGGDRPDALSVAYRVVKEVVKDRPDLVIKSARCLAKRGDTARSAVVSSMCEASDASTILGIELSALYLDAGAVSVVRDALEDAKRKGLDDLKGLHETECLIQILEAEKSLDILELLNTFKNGDGKLTMQARQTCLAMVCRGAWRGTFFLLGRSVDEDLRRFVELCFLETDDDICNFLADHIRVLTHIAQGSFRDAYVLLLSAKGRLSGAHVSQALLTMDYVFCSIALGNAPTRSNMAVFREAYAFLSASGFNRLTTLCELALSVGRVLGGRASDEDAMDTALYRADRTGDEFLRAALLLVCGVKDMRQGGYVRAHVRFGLAGRSFAAMGLKTLKAETDILDIAVRLTLDEQVPREEIRACKGVTDSLDQVLMILLKATSKLSPRNIASNKANVSGGEYHLGNVFWLMNVLLNDCGALSGRIRKATPDHWCNFVARGITEVETLFTDQVLPRSGLDDVYGLSLMRERPDGARGNGAKPKIYVSVFGSLKVQVDGVVIPPESIARRNAAELLLLLGAVHGHVLERYKVIESLWPDYDIESGRSRIYAAINVLRHEAKAATRDPGDSEILVMTNDSDRGTVSLNEFEVVCDVDIFEDLVRTVLHKEGQDSLVMNLCKEVDALYVGNLQVPTKDCAGILNDRMIELKGLFVDAMILGSNAALRLGYSALSNRFAQRALEVDDSREDVIEVVVNAFRASGRGPEAFDIYDSFANRLQKTDNCLPSRSLRAAMERFRAEEGMRYIRSAQRKPTILRGAIQVVSVFLIEEQ